MLVNANPLIPEKLEYQSPDNFVWIASFGIFRLSNFLSKDKKFFQGFFRQ